MYIVITQPYFFKGEAERITAMFQSGLQRLHLRKPDSSIDDCRALLRDIPQCYHPRISLCDHYELLNEFDTSYIHCSKRNEGKLPSKAWDYCMSYSCHSINELKLEKNGYNYVTLSPIFNSISKQGYNAAFTHDELLKAKAEGIIDERVMALGGICRDNIDEALSLGFGGVMVLGDAWVEQQPPVVLSIAGSDPSAGAGIQQDLKTMTNCGCYGTTVITALTSQNTLGVQAVIPVPADVVESQLRSVFSDMRVEAVKIGMIPNRSVAQAIVKVLKDERRKCIMHVIYDPVMMSTSGTQLMDDECIDYVAHNLFPLCTLVTPNIPERQHLESLGYSTQRTEFLSDMSRDHLLSTGGYIVPNMLVKGGHADSDTMTDTLHLADEMRTIEYSLPKVETTNLHGTGCTLSSAIASYMAQGHSLTNAVSLAKQYIHQAIIGGIDLHIGHGNGPLWPTP